MFENRMCFIKGENTKNMIEELMEAKTNRELVEIALRHPENFGRFITWEKETYTGKTVALVEHSDGISRQEDPFNLIFTEKTINEMFTTLRELREKGAILEAPTLSDYRLMSKRLEKLTFQLRRIYAEKQ